MEVCPEVAISTFLHPYADADDDDDDWKLEIEVALKLWSLISCIYVDINHEMTLITWSKNEINETVWHDVEIKFHLDCFYSILLVILYS